MGTEALIVLAVILIAVVLFVTEKLSIDLVGLLIISVLVLSGVITPKEGVEGFSNNATLTVAFMFVLSAALLKTGALQMLTPKLSALFQRDFRLGLLVTMLAVASVSAFINNTPVVAVFIPIMVQVAHSSGRSPSKLLIPLSYASIFGGTCTLIGTSTNVLVSGIAEEYGIGGISMFEVTPMGLIFAAAGILYMIIAGYRLLPERNGDKGLANKFGMQDYITEIELAEDSDMVNIPLMRSPLVLEMDMDIIEVRRGDSRFNLPPGDFILQKGDVLKVRCDVEKLRALKDRVRVTVQSPVKVGDEDLLSRNMTLTELVIPFDSEFIGKRLRDLDFRRKYRGVPLAMRHRDDLVNAGLYDVRLKAGDLILAEIKTHHLTLMKKQEQAQKLPFLILSEQEGGIEFNKKKFAVVMAIVGIIITLATFNVVDIMIGSIAGTALLVLLGILNMKEVYDSIDWKVIFLLAGALSLGVGMQKSGLAAFIASGLVGTMGQWGPVAILAGLYFLTSMLTEIMSNNATAALITPIAIVTAQTMGLSPTPFLFAVMFAASASFMTPVGYQTNAMIYNVGSYRFVDFTRIGVWLNLLFWLLAVLFIPMLYPF